MQLNRHTQTSIVEEIATVSTAYGHENLFNLSLNALPFSYSAAYRARLPGEKFFRAYYTDRAHKSESAQPWSPPVDLHDVAASEGIDRVADPKLFNLNDAIYATFNTGFAANHTNDIYIMRVAPTIGPIQKCVLAHGRSRVEKNWAFYASRNGSLAGVYSLEPLALLEHVSGTLGTNEDLVFVRRLQAIASDSRIPGWTIGTQPLVLPDRLLLIAHEKISIAGRRSYFGRLVEISLDGSGVTQIRASGKRLVHSHWSMLPRHGTHNPNLMSATYFAGISRIGTDLILSYGINDVGFGVARILEEALWA